jgi:predicted AlkP superfamily pyrophosphatase or phosphodiesterase
MKSQPRVQKLLAQMRKIWATETETRSVFLMMKKLLLIILDGVPYRNWVRVFGNLEGWVKSGDAQRFKMSSVLPSTSASCYASIHTGVSPQVHGVTGNDTIFRLSQPDVFSQARKSDLLTGAVTHSFWSEFFNRAPFDPLRDIEYDEPDSQSINHGRFHTMAGYGHNNQMTPSDADLFATLSMLCQRFGLDYGILHTCTLDSMGHRFYHDSPEMDHACFMMDYMLAPWIIKWRDMGYQVIVTADHGQDERGHHGGHDPLQQEFALYYFGDAQAVEVDTSLDQLQLAPTILSLLGATIPDTMKAPVFLK